MGARTTAREAALQVLYAIEATGQPADEAIEEFWRELPGDAEGRSYADAVVRGVMNDVEAMDHRIRQACQNWRLERMTRVDRSVLRLAGWELVHCPNVPRAVVLDEAVEIAKRFGTEESGAFVNGVLSRVADDCGRWDDDGSLDGGEDSVVPSSTPPRPRAG